MKFSNGCWIMKEGVGCFSPQEVYFTNIEKDFVRLTAPTSKIFNRGCTLGGVVLTLEISAPVSGVIRVKTYHYKGGVKDAPHFELNLDDGAENLLCGQNDEEIRVYSGYLMVRIKKQDFAMEYIRLEEIPEDLDNGQIKGQVLSRSSGRDLAYIKTDWKGDAYVKSTDNDMYMRQQLSVAVDEKFYGFGEKFTPFIKNGQTVEMWNEDGGTATDISYKSIPFYTSSRGYGVFVNHTDKVSFEVCSEIVNKVNFTVPGEELDYFFIDGPDLKEVLSRYTHITGRPALPPAWTFGLWLSTSFTTNYDEETVMSFIDGMLERDIPLKVFHFDCFWMKDFHWTNFKWDERVFPDPKGMLKRIHDKGLKVCVWINPYIAQESELFDQGMEKGYFLKRPDGGVWQWDMWQPGMAIVDFTNPEAVDWYKNQLKDMMEMGVDAFKTDFGERIPEDAVYYNGKNARKMHNYYTYLYNKAVFQVIEEVKGKDQAVLFARSATAGGQKFPVHWGGDCWSDYESMEQSLRGGLSLQMSGFGFWSHDIGGFEHTSTPDVYKRWAAFGLMSSHSRLHGSTSYRVPWVYDEESVDVVRFYTKLKSRLMPYIWDTALNASSTGIPSMRSMVLEYPEDKMCQYLDKQYMFGDSLLVSPVFNDKSMAEYYLPEEEGAWTDIVTGKEYQGGKWIKEKVSYTEMPILARPGSLIAFAASDKGPEYDVKEGFILKLYKLGEGDEVVANVYKQTGDYEEVIAVNAARDEDGTISLGIKSKENCPLTLVLVNEKASSVSGGQMKIEGNDTVISIEGEVISISF
ncbi:MAG: alpha-xylosidase [Eubacterium sp.]|nr:alpha-xylosidase [Eubacterium sp.]